MEADCFDTCGVCKMHSRASFSLCQIPVRPIYQWNVNVISCTHYVSGVFFLFFSSLLENVLINFKCLCLFVLVLICTYGCGCFVYIIMGPLKMYMVVVFIIRPHFVTVS